MKNRAIILFFLIGAVFFVFAILFGRNVVERFSDDRQMEKLPDNKVQNVGNPSNEAPIGEELSFEEQVWEDRIQNALEDVNCLDADAPYFGAVYNGPLIDAHYHIANIPDGSPDSREEDYSEETRPLLGVNTKISDIICSLEREGTKKVFAFFSVYKEIPKPMVEVVKRTMEKYPDKFVPFIMPPDNDGSPDGSPTVNAETLQNMLAIEPDLFKGYGEIGLYARGDHGGPKGSLALPPDSARLIDIYPIVRKNNLVIYFHLGEGQRESFEKVLEQNPDINFIWHGDQLISYGSGGQDLSDVDEILTNHPNVYYGVDELYGDVWLLKPEVSKEEFFEHFEDYESLLEKDVKTWKAFIEKHPDQIIWGTDRGGIALWSIDEDVGITLTNYARAFIARLDPAVQEKFAYKNAEKLINER